MALKEDYEKLAKKYRLPDFEELDKSFELSEIEETKFLLAAIRKKMHEKIDYMTNLFENLLYPNSELSFVYEISFLKEGEKEKAFELYKRLMLLSRSSLKLSLENDEKQDAEFIRDFFGEWNQIKRDISEIIERLKESWKTKEDTKFRVEYLG